MQELMDEFAEKADSLPDTLDANVAYLVFQECYDMAKSMLEKEKEVMRQFGIRCIDGYYSGSISEEDFTETFFAKKFFQEDFTEFFDKTFKPTKEK